MHRFFFFLISIALFIACQSNTESQSNNQSSSANNEPAADTISSKEIELPKEANEEALKPVNNEMIEKKKAEAKTAVAQKSSQKSTPPVVKQAKEESKTEKKEEKTIKEEEKQETVVDLIPNHNKWNTMLSKHVSSTGKVNYAGIKADKANLESYLNELSSNTPKDTWGKNEQLAYWINAYNAFTVKLIIDNYPLASITELHGGKPWDVKWIVLGNKTYSLNNIENDIIRPQFGDARIHFAVNCAAKSCPPLLNKAYKADPLSRQLELQSKKFINNVSYNHILGNKITISKIFDWYKVDFGASLVDYLNRYANTSIPKEATINFKEYDWSLNN